MEGKIRFIWQGLMEIQSGLIVDARFTSPSCHARRVAAQWIVEQIVGRLSEIALGGTKTVAGTRKTIRGGGSRQS